MPLPAWLTPKRIRITLIVIACVSALPLAVVEENWRGKHEFERYKRELEAKGEHFDIASFLGLEIPDDQNFVMAPVFKPLFDYTFDPVTRMFDYKDPGAPVMNISTDVIPRHTLAAMDFSKIDYPLHAKGNWQMGQMRDLEPWQKFYREVLPELALSKSPAEDVLAALGKFDPLLAQVREAAATRPLSRFPLKFDTVPTGTEYYSAMQRLDAVLAMRASAELSLGRADDAFADVKLCFRLAESTRRIPTMLAALVRLTLMNALMQPVWEGIASHRWTNAQLAQLEVMLQGEDFLENFQFTMRGERAWSALGWEKMRTDPAMVTSALPSSKITRAIFQTLRIYNAITWQNELYQCRTLQEKVLPLVDAKTRRVDVRASDDLLGDTKGYDLYTYFVRAAIPGYVNIFKKYAIMQTYLDEARVACEIERYRRAHGALPAKIEELHMADLPHDLIDGNPLRYLVTGPNDYLLYSIGWNQTDDGGVVGRDSGSDRQNYDKGDWVWSLSPL